MKMNKMKYSIIAILMFGFSMSIFAGNPDRAGSAGVGQLLINPWARSAGLANSNMASINGTEAVFSNVAGLVFMNKTELNVSSTLYMVGSDITVNSAAFGQKVGESGAIGISIMTMSFGDIPITTVANPEGNIGEFSPNYSNIGLSYAKEFSNSIYGGITFRVISESISNVRSQGVAFDAGIRYVTGERDNVRFGIALKNVGPAMRYRGDGLSVTAVIPTNQTELTVEQRSDKYELPTLVNIGFAYDFLLNEKMELTGSGQFISNSFTRDQFGFGAELNFNEMLQLRAGYQWETDITNSDDRATAITGPAAGLSVEFGVGSSDAVIGLDYSYRVTNPFDGIHSMGIHIDL